MAKQAKKSPKSAWKNPKIGKKKPQFSLDDSLHTSNLPIKVEKFAKFPWNCLKMIKNPLKTAQNGQKRPKNHLKVPEKGLKLAQMTKIPLKSPDNDKKNT